MPDTTKRPKELRVRSLQPLCKHLSRHFRSRGPFGQELRYGIGDRLPSGLSTSFEVRGPLWSTLSTGFPRNRGRCPSSPRFRAARTARPPAPASHPRRSRAAGCQRRNGTLAARPGPGPRSRPSVRPATPLPGSDQPRGGCERNRRAVDDEQAAIRPWQTGDVPHAGLGDRVAMECAVALRMERQQPSRGRQLEMGEASIREGLEQQRRHDCAVARSNLAPAPALRSLGDGPDDVGPVEPPAPARRTSRVTRRLRPARVAAPRARAPRTAA